MEKPKVEFNISTLYSGHFAVTYRGVKTIKCPFDYVMYQMLVFNLKPDLIIEIGTNVGGTALYLADMLNIIGKGEVHTIDVAENHPDKFLSSNPRIKLFTEGYQNYDLELTKGLETILVIEDGAHTYEDVSNSIKKFSSVVTKDSYMIVEDGIVTELGIGESLGGGPLKAIDEFLLGNSDFVIDKKWCDMFGTNATFNVNGFLKKIR